MLDYFFLNGAYIFHRNLNLYLLNKLRCIFENGKE